jgi:hypothetical protein
MISEQGPEPAPTGADRDTVVSPVLVVARTFPARPSSLPEAHEFVRTSLTGAVVEQNDIQAISAAINEAVLAASGPQAGAYQIVVRVFPDQAEVEVLCSADDEQSTLRPERSQPGSFADWLTAALREDGLSQEAAARQLGVSVRTVNRWLRGHTEPRLRDLRRIQEVLGHHPLP